MVNRYITALLVVLAATGMEAQTYQQALRFALTDISYDEFIQQPEAKALEEDILSVIKAIKEASEDHQKAQHHFPSAIQKADTSANLTESNPYICFTPPHRAQISGSIRKYCYSRTRFLTFITQNVADLQILFVPLQP